MAKYPSGLVIYKTQPIERSEWDTKWDPIQEDPKSFELDVLRKNHGQDFSSATSKELIKTDGLQHYYIAVNIKSGQHTFKMIDGETTDELVKQFPKGHFGIINRMPEYAEEYAALTVVPDGKGFKALKMNTKYGITIDHMGKVVKNERVLRNAPQLFHVTENKYIPTFESFINKNMK